MAVAEAPPHTTSEIEIRRAPKVTHRWITAASAAVVAAALVVGAVLVTRGSDARNGTPPEAAGGLTDTTWALSGTPGSTLRIADDGTLTGNDGCNALGGHAKINGDRLTLTVATTDMYCPGSTFAKTDLILSGTVTWSVSGDRLTLTKSGVGSLTYRAATASRTDKDPTHLFGTWELRATDTYSGTAPDQAVGHRDAISSSTVTFDGNGGFRVVHRCYSNKGRADVAAGTARLTDITLNSAIPCASNTETTAGQAENDLVDSVLTGAVTWSIRKEMLTVTNSDVGALTLSAIRSGPATAPSTTAGPAGTVTNPAGRDTHS